MEDSLKEPQQLNLIMKGLHKQAKTCTRLPINPTLLQTFIHEVLSMRHMERWDRYLYATAVCLAYFGCLRAGEISYPSAHYYHSKQHLTMRDIKVHNNTVQLWLKQSKTENRSIKEGCYYQSRYLSSAHNKAVSILQEAHICFGCCIPISRRLIANSIKAPNYATQSIASA